MTSDFYCDEALSGRTPVEIVMETDDVLAFQSNARVGSP